METIKTLYKIGAGPSSSHTMGPMYAAEYMKNKYPNCKNFEVFLYGSLALTGKGHLTDKILLDTLGENTNIIFDYKTLKDHPNTLIIKAIEEDC